MARSRNTAAAAGALVCLAVIASVVFFAVQADGREGTESTTNDGGAWLVNQRSGAIGHVNREVEELSAAVRVSQPGALFDVAQPEGAIIAHDVTANTLEIVDERTHLLVNTLTMPRGSVIEKYATGIVVVAEGPFRVWRFESTELTGIQSLESREPLYVADRTPAWAVSESGEIAIDDAATDSVVIAGVDGPTTSWSRSGTVDQIVFDGDRPVVQLGAQLGVADDDRIDVRGGDVQAWAAVQQPTADRSGSIVVATDLGRVLRVDTSNGSSELIGELPGADPGSLIVHDGCVFAVTNEPANFWVRCGAGEPRTTPLQVSPGSNLRLRLVNGWVWINDLATGSMWLVEDSLELSRIDDWGAVLPQDTNLEDLEISSAESEDDIVEEIENPDAEDALTVDADQFDEDGINQPPVAFDDDETETHQGRAVLVNVIGNDEDPDNDVLLISLVENLSGSDATVQVAANGTTIQVSPAPDFEGVVRFRYTITDGRGGSDSALGAVTVRARTGADNRAPITVTDIGSITVGERLIINVLTNDYDPDGDSLVLETASAAEGTLSFDASGQVIFEPESISEEGEIEITYVVVDDFGERSEGRLRAAVRLEDSNQPPDARNDGGITVVAQPITLNLLANDTDPDGDDLFVAQRPELLSPPDAQVFTTITAEGEFVFIPDEAGTYLFSYGASDEAATDLAQIRVEVNELSGNSIPVAVRDDVVIPAGESRIVYSLVNDTDPDGDVVGIVDFNVTPGSGLRVEQFGDVGFRVFADETGAPRRTFRYSISDGESDPVETIVVVAVANATSANQPPIAQPDTVEIRPGSSVAVAVLDNDFDPEGGPLEVAAVSNPDGGLAQIGPAGQSVRISVSPATVTSFSVNYDVIDDNGNRTAAVIRVRVVPVGEPNRPPVARPDSARTPFESALAVKVILNDSDPDGDAIRVESVTAQPLNGTAVVDTATGDVLYTPADGFSGTDRFSYVIVDALGARNEGEVLVGVMPEPRPNRNPIAEDDSYLTVATGQSIDFAVLLNDRDPDGDQLRIASFDEPAIGEVSSTLDGRQLVFRAPVSQARDETVAFAYTISDGAGGTATAEVIVLVQATPPRPEGAPIAVDDEVGPAQTGEEVRVDVTANDSDPDGLLADLGVAVFDPSVRVEGQTVVFVAPDADTEFSYQITDADGNQDAATIQVRVINLRPPVAIDDQFGPVTRGDVVDIDVLLNDYDLDAADTGGAGSRSNAGLSVVSVTGADAQVGDGFVRITAPAESAQYTYTIRDGDGLDATATISLIVTENRAPVVSPEAVSTPFQESIEIDLSTAAIDPDGDPLFYSCCQSAQNGSPFVLEAGEGRLVVDFTPDESFSGDAVFSFEVDDQFGNVVAGSVTVTVEEQPNRQPTVVDSDTTIQVPRPEGPPVTTEVDLASLTDDPDDDDVLAWVLASSPGQGLSATVEGSILSVTATDASEPGTTTLTWVTTDPEGASATGSVTVTVEAPQNEPPSAVDTSISISAGAATTTTDLGALVTDTDDAEILDFEIDPLAVDGVTATLTGESIVTLAAAVNASGTSASFEYVVTDRMGETGSGTVTIDVGDPDQDPPVAQPDDAETFQEVAVEIPVLANDVDPLGQGLTIIDPGSTTNGSIALSGSSITFTPGVGYFGSTSFSYTIGDAAEVFSRQATGQVTIQVIGRPDQPAAPACTPDSREVALTWTQPTNDNGASIDGYMLEHDQGDERTIGNRTSETWDLLRNATEYRFRVAASNAAGVGDFSEWSLPCTPDIEPEQPAPPQVAHGNRVLTVTWTEPANNGSQIEGYELRIVGGETIPFDGDVFTHPWEPLTNGQDHTFQVAARNAKGLSTFSTPSTPEHPSTTPDAPVIQATSRAGLIGANASGTLQVNWTPVPVANDGGDTILHYLIERRPGGGTPPRALGANASSYIWSGLANGEPYEFRVIAVNRDGEGTPSAWSPALEACTVPNPPIDLSATAGNRQVTVTFAPPGDDGGCDLTGYRVRTAGSSGAGVFEPHPPGPITIGGLDNGTPYSFEVQAISTFESSSWVATPNAYTPKGPPVCPDNGYTVDSIAPVGTATSWQAADFNGGTNNRYERIGISGEWHDLGSGTFEQLSNWGDGTFTLRLEAVNEVGRDDCGSITWTGCPATPPAPPTPNFQVDQNARTLRVFNLVEPTIGCLSQPEVTGDYDIVSYEVTTEQLTTPSGLVTSPLTLPATAVEFEFGPGLPPGWQGRFRVAACYRTGTCGATTGWMTAEVEEFGTISIAQSGVDFIPTSGSPAGHCFDAVGIQASGGDPDDGCFYVRIDMAGWSGTHTVRCFGTGFGGTWVLIETLTLGNGLRDACSYSQAGRAVVAIVDGSVAGQPNRTVNVSPPAVASNMIDPWPS